MPSFSYQAINKSGKTVKGQLEAETKKRAIAQLKATGLFVTGMEDKNKASLKKNTTLTITKVKTKEIALMTRQLATLLKSNIPIVEALSVVSEQSDSPYLSSVLFQIKDMVNEGESLFKSMGKYPHIFNKTFLSMIEAGEASGTLDIILIRLAEFTEDQSALLSKIQSAMIYPVLMMTMMLALLVFLFTVIIPKITAIFDATEELTLEWYTLAVINFSGFLVEEWYIILIGVFVITISFINWKKSEKGQMAWEQFILKIPIFGDIIRLVAVSRFTKTLATLLKGGVPMLKALSIVQNVVNNHTLADAIEKAGDNIREGESIAAPLKASKQFPPMVIHMVRIGEKTGNLEGMLEQVSNAYDFQVKTTVEGLTSLLEPIMIIVMGLVIGAIVFSVVVPMLQLSNIGA